MQCIGADFFQLSFSSCRPSKLEQQQSDRRHILLLFRSFCVYLGFVELCKPFLLLLKVRRSDYCSFPNVIVFRIDSYLSFYCLKPFAFHKGCFVTATRDRTGVVSSRRDIVNSIWSCVVAIDKYYEMSFVYYQTCGWKYSPCENLKIFIEVLQPFWDTCEFSCVWLRNTWSRNFTKVTGNAEVLSQGFQFLLKLKHLNIAWSGLWSQNHC